jgi:hypothetical protein
MNTSKNREKFVKLAETRVNKAIKAIKLVGNLSDKTNYSYTEEDVRKIMTALNKELNSVKSRYTSGSKLDEPRFQL